MKSKILFRHGGTTCATPECKNFVSWWFTKNSHEGVKILCGIVFILTVASTYAQNTSVKKPVTKTAAPAVQLKTLEDSANYAMGLSIANFYRQQGVTKINSTLVTKAINDAMSGKPTLLSDAQTSTVLMTYLNNKQMMKSKPNIDACNNFLVTNKKRQGVVTTTSRLQLSNTPMFAAFRNGHPSNKAGMLPLPVILKAHSVAYLLPMERSTKQQPKPSMKFSLKY